MLLFSEIQQLTVLTHIIILSRIEIISNFSEILCFHWMTVLTLLTRYNTIWYLLVHKNLFLTVLTHLTITTRVQIIFFFTKAFLLTGSQFSLFSPAKIISIYLWYIVQQLTFQANVTIPMYFFNSSYSLVHSSRSAN